MQQQHNHTLDTFTEESVIVFSITKWVILASITGIIVGTASALFLKALDFSSGLVGDFQYHYFLLPLVLPFIVYVTLRYAPDSKGHGTEKVIRAVHKNQGKLRLRVVPVKMLTTIATLTFGGSVGKEGPCAQIGAALASYFAQLCRFSIEDRKKLVICGISAGFAAVFGTPIAGAIFGVEVLFMGSLMYNVLLPSFISGMVAYQVANALGIEYHYSLMTLAQGFDLGFFMLIIAAGMFFGLVSMTFIESSKWLERYVQQLNMTELLKAFIGGVVFLVVIQLSSSIFLGLGLKTIDNALSGHSIFWYAFLIKIFLTCLTLAIGGSGGVITPIFFVGATAGVAFGNVFGLDAAIFAAIGMVSVLAGAANTPLAACVLAIELFGPSLAPYATIACVISYFMTGNRSLFPSQVLSGSKAPGILINQGEEVENFEPHYDYSTRKALVSSRVYAKRVFRKVKR